MCYFKKLLTLIFVLFPVYSHALTLGEVDVKSFINQRLDANIEVLSLGNAEPLKIKAFLASKEDFIKYDVDRLDLLDEIRFVTYQNKSGKTYIHLSSHKLIREPLISFILNIRTVEGNLSREYNLFLSPSPETQLSSQKNSNKKFDNGQNTKSLINTNNKAESIENMQQIEEIVATTVLENKQLKPEKNNIYRPDLNFNMDDYELKSRYGPTKSGQMISLIAQQIRPDNSYSIQKIAKLLFQLNPDAFLNNDINKLKKGYMLKLPNLNNPDFRKNSFAYLDRGSNKNEPSSQSKTISKSKNFPEEKLATVLVADSDISKDVTELKLLADDNNVLDISKLAEELDVADDFINAQELLNLSIDKMQILKEENHTLHEQFDLLMNRMEDLIKKNNFLDEALNQIKSKAQKEKSKLIVKNTIKADKPLSENKVLNLIKTGKIDNKHLKTAQIDWYFWIVSALIVIFSMFVILVIVFKIRHSKRELIPQEYSMDDAWNDKNNAESKIENSKELSTQEASLKNEYNEKYSDQTDSEAELKSEFSLNAEPELETEIANKLDTEQEENFDFKLDLDVDNDNSGLKDELYFSQTDETNRDVGSNARQQVSQVSASQTVENSVANTSVRTTSAVNFNDILAPSKSMKSNDNVDLISQSSVYFAYGKFDLAEQLLIDGISVDPSNRQLLLKLFECYAKMGDETKFMSYLSNVKELYSEDAEFKLSVSNMYEKQWDKSLF